MLNPGYTSIDRVVENVIRDTGFTDDINYSDIVEWVFIAQELINVPSTYIQKVTDGNKDWNHYPPMEIINHRASLPCDFHKLISIREYCSKLPMIGDSGTFLKSQNQSDITRYSNLTYTINADYIFTNVEEGFLEVSYWAFPTDDDGLPLVPNDVTYLKAIEAFLTERLARRMLIQGKMDRYTFELLEKEWLFYVKSAKSKAALPSYDQAEALKNQILRLVQRPNQHKWNYSGLTNQEQAYTNRNRRLSPSTSGAVGTYGNNTVESNPPATDDYSS